MRLSKFVTVSIITLLQTMLAFGTVTSFTSAAHAGTKAKSKIAATSADDQNGLDELDPFDPNIDLKLQQMDLQYKAATGQDPILAQPAAELFGVTLGNCYRESCAVYAHVDKEQQRLLLYLNGQLAATWPTSTGVPGRGTPNLDKHPDGRIYDHYESTKFPGGDFDGLGNMPYAVFVSGGVAIHGTGRGNWSKLGHVASHGCIRIHPDNALKFNRLVRQYGVANTWVLVD
jgi:lipoprotein-anchoring transpeptidase ErfK/SrfK